MKKRHYNASQPCTHPKTFFFVAYSQPSGAIKVTRNRIQVAWLEKPAATVEELAACIAATTGCPQFIIEWHKRNKRIDTIQYPPAIGFWDALGGLK